MFALLCFCVATEFSVNKDLYIKQLWREYSRENIRQCLVFFCSCSYLFTFLLPSRFYWHIRLKSTTYFLTRPVCGRAQPRSPVAAEESMPGQRTCCLGSPSLARRRRVMIPCISCTHAPIHTPVQSSPVSCISYRFRDCTASYLSKVANFNLPACRGGSVAEWLACWTQAQKGLSSNRNCDAVG